MYRLHLYLPEELKNKISHTARAKRQPKAQVVREALEKGLKAIQPKKSSSAQALLELAKLAEKIPSDPKDPKDLSINHNYYAWGGEKDY